MSSSLPVRVARRAARTLTRPIHDIRIRGDMDRIRDGYAEILGRPIDRSAAATWSRELRLRRLSADDVLDRLRTSPEALINGSDFYPNVHAARMQWVAGLAPFASILDIGGSSPTDQRGALIELGYGHRPAELDILDRPVDRQFHGRPDYDQDDVDFDWGRVRYHHGQAEDITTMSGLVDRQFECIFMGQTIEHIAVDRLSDVLDHVRQLLAPNGRFIFDTPNRAVTRVLMGDQYLTHDHTYEYEPDELADLVAGHGFEIVRRTGIVPMPATVASGTFDADESAHQPWLVDDPEGCFVFALEAVAAS